MLPAILLYGVRTFLSKIRAIRRPAPLFVHMEGVIVHRDNPCRVLTAVLKQKQIVVDLLVDRVNTEHSDNAAHDESEVREIRKRNDRQATPDSITPNASVGATHHGKQQHSVAPQDRAEQPIRIGSPVETPRSRCPAG